MLSTNSTRLRWSALGRSGSAAALVVVSSLFTLGGCSGAAGESPVATSTAFDRAPSGTQADPPTDPTTDPTTGARHDTAESSGESSGTLPGIVTVPEVGIPGLDSADRFCAAWSRFGGSWQVLQVAAYFGPSPSVVPSLEVLAAPVVVDAFDTMFAVWPAELDGEREVVRTEYFGALRRRAEVALDTLAAVGATDGDLAGLAAAWEDALSSRRGDDVVPPVALTRPLDDLVTSAADELEQRTPGFLDDPALLIVAETPATDMFLATACPDQGVLAGSEVGAG